MTEREWDKPFTKKELQTILAAMSGNFPDSLNDYRYSAIKKLWKLDEQVTVKEVE